MKLRDILSADTYKFIMKDEVLVMFRIITFFMVGFLSFAYVTSRSGKMESAPAVKPVRTVDEEEIGGDWHTWGLYSFERVNDTTIAIDQVNDEKGRHIGYDIYKDGESLGAKLGKIRCTDAGYSSDDIDVADYLYIEDGNGDGLEDIALPLKNGDVMWYYQYEHEHIGLAFAYSKVVKADGTVQEG